MQFSQILSTSLMRATFVCRNDLSNLIIFNQIDRKANNVHPNSLLNKKNKLLKQNNYLKQKMQ